MNDSGLTEQQQKACDISVSLWEALLECELTSEERTKCADAIHTVQLILAYQYMKRNFSEYWR